MAPHHAPFSSLQTVMLSGNENKLAVEGRMTV
jgi:hypothetical protein